MLLGRLEVDVVPVDIGGLEGDREGTETEAYKSVFEAVKSHSILTSESGSV